MASDIARCGGVLLAALVLAAGPSDAPVRAEGRSGQTYALLVNGGGSAADNALSHLHHLQDMVDNLIARGISRQRIFVFSSDGEDPDKDLAVRGSLDGRLWLVQGTDIERPLYKPDLTNSTWDGVELRAATVAELRKWFARMARTIDADDTLMIFVTDHGTRNSKDPANGFISLWNESLSVLEFRALLAHLEPGTRVVNVMSQCYSGAFAESMSPLHDSTPSGDVCGFYSTTANRQAYGCYPEGRDKDRIGHAFRFIDAMSRNGSFEAAHREVLVSDATPDVPVRTSGLYVERFLGRRAAAAEVDRKEFIDALLREAWRDRGRWEPQIRLLDRIGSVYGVFSPRSLEELGEHIVSLRSLSKELSTYTDRWKLTLDDLRRDNLDRFREANPDWKKRLARKKVAALGPSGRSQLVGEFLPLLETFIRSREDVWERLEWLRQTHADAQGSKYQVEIRLAALLRMRAILVRVAARQLLESGLGDERIDKALAAYTALEHCERTTIGTLDPTGEVLPLSIEPLPPFSEDLEVVERILPSWLGIRFAPLSEAKREELGLERGAVVVNQVYEESAARAAGITPGDLILGPPGGTFHEPRSVREWIMRSPRDTPLQLGLLREGRPTDVTVSLGPYPIELPRLPAPPVVGDEAPVLPAMRSVSGPVPGEGSHVLFFWATWCGPCKAALPELLAWSEGAGVPVLAVSDESPDKIRTFLDGWSEPFPERVLSDDLRTSFVTYGVSGTPTFVLVDAEGTIEWRQTGYSPVKGLGLDDWDWNK